jgi:hypothetical protein
MDGRILFRLAQKHWKCELNKPNQGEDRHALQITILAHPGRYGI